MHVGKTPKSVGIALGSDLFAECVRREMITMEIFGVEGTMLFAQKLPALNRSVFVFAQPFIDPWDFQIGPQAHA